MEKLNVSQIVGITVYKSKRILDAEWRPFKKGTFFRMDEERGFYNTSYGGEKYTDKVLENYVVIGEKLYQKPFVIIETTSGSKRRVDFLTTDELDWFMKDKNLRTVNWVEIPDSNKEL